MMFDEDVKENIKIIKYKVGSKKMEKAMAPHSSTLAWKIPWMEEPGRLQSMGSLSQTRLSDFTFTFHYHALEKDPLQCSCLENPRDGGAWWAAVYEGTQSQTRLKRLSNSSSSSYCFLPWNSHFMNIYWVHNICNQSYLPWIKNPLKRYHCHFTDDIIKT